jgi:DNA invertase Pin-like site-specific DNA recombinase
MNVIGYIRVSTDKQDLEKQNHLLLEYAQRHQLLINEFINVEVSSRKNTKERRIDELLAKLQKGDTLIVAELSRLGRNMLETLNIINELGENGVSIIFVRQPELSTTGPHTKLLLAIYSYFAEAEREYISLRTKQGLAAARAKGNMRLLPRRVIKWRLTRLLPKIDDNPVGTKHTIKVTVEIWDGNKWVAAKDEQVFFQVVEGPNAGRSDTETSDADGQVEFTYLDTGGPGHDVIEIRYTDPAGTTHIQTAFKSWLRKEER